MHVCFGAFQSKYEYSFVILFCVQASCHLLAGQPQRYHSPPSCHGWKSIGPLLLFQSALSRAFELAESAVQHSPSRVQGPKGYPGLRLAIQETQKSLLFLLDDRRCGLKHQVGFSNREGRGLQLRNIETQEEAIPLHSGHTRHDSRRGRRSTAFNWPTGTTPH